QAALRCGRRIFDPDDSPWHGAKGTAVRRPNVLAVHAVVCDLAVRHRVLSRRPAGIGWHVLDLAVHFDHPGAAGHRDARASVARDDPGAETFSESGMMPLHGKPPSPPDTTPGPKGPGL